MFVKKSKLRNFIVPGLVQLCEPALCVNNRVALVSQILLVLFPALDVPLH